MAVSLQVIYPITDGTSFDYDYYTGPHMQVVEKHLSSFVDSVLVTKGLAGGPDTPPGHYAIATLLFKDHDTLNAAMEAAPPVVEDIANFTNVQPQILIGEVIS